MSTKKRKSAYQRRCNKPLIKGKFYRVKDRNGRHRRLLFHQIDPKLECTGAKSFIITQPQIVKYEQFKHPYPYENLRVHKDDKAIVKRVQNKK